jgi:enoyl-CoA hydratase/3-hydroxyacyl-CoA dehydrogenase
MPMGPFELLDYAGVDVHRHVLLYYAENLHPDYKPYRTLEEMVKAGKIGRKAGKGFYNWSRGRPEIDPMEATDKVDPMDITAVQINEATKLIEMGVCSTEDIDLAIVNGSGMEVGPMTIAKDQDPTKLAQRLEQLAERFHKEIFRPTQMIRDGTFKVKK